MKWVGESVNEYSHFGCTVRLFAHDFFVAHDNWAGKFFRSKCHYVVLYDLERLFVISLCCYRHLINEFIHTGSTIIYMIEIVDFR